MFLSFFCHLLSFFLSLVKSLFCHFLVVFYFLALFMFLSFSHKDQASGEGGKPGLGNAKKMQKITPGLGNAKKNAKKMTPSLGNAKNMQKKAKKMQQKMQKNDSRAGKVAFLEFPGRPRFSGLSRPPPGHWAGPAPRAGRQLLVQAGPKTNSPGQARVFLHLFLVFGAATR